MRGAETSKCGAGRAQAGRRARAPRRGCGRAARRRRGRVCSSLHVLLADLLVDERLVDVGDHTTARDGGLRWGREVEGERALLTGGRRARARALHCPHTQCPDAHKPLDALKPSAPDTVHMPTRPLLLVPSRRACGTLEVEPLRARAPRPHRAPTLMRVSSSSSPRMASCRWRGVMRFTCGPEGIRIGAEEVVRRHAVVERGGRRAPPASLPPIAAIHAAQAIRVSLLGPRMEDTGPARGRSPPGRAGRAHLEILGSVAGQLQHLGGQVLCARSGVCM